MAISHVKGEFRYGSGMVELCLYDFNGPSSARVFFGTSFLVIPPNQVAEMQNHSRSSDLIRVLLSTRLKFVVCSW